MIDQNYPAPEQVITDAAMRALMLAMIENAVNDLKGENSHATPLQARRAAYWLAGEGPAWFAALGIGLPVARFHDWIDSELQKWEER